MYAFFTVCMGKVGWYYESLMKADDLSLKKLSVKILFRQIIFHWETPYDAYGFLILESVTAVCLFADCTCTFGSKQLYVILFNLNNLFLFWNGPQSARPALVST